MESTEDTRNNRCRIRTETVLDVTVRWVSVYTVAAMGMFLVVKEILIGDFLVCQPINRAIRENLSYSQSQARYDVAYCTSNMLDFTGNLKVATTYENGAIPGVTILGVREKGAQVLHEKYIPFAFLIQAAVCYLPTLVWYLYGSDLLRAAVRYIAATSWKICPREAARAASFSETSSPNRGSLGRYLDELGSDVEIWLSRRYLVHVYVAKLMVTVLVLVAALCFYLLYPDLNIFSFKEMLVCHVDRQTLVRCLIPDAFLFKLFWIVNLVLLDVCLLFTTFQLLNLAFCTQRRRNFFFLKYLGITEGKYSKIATDAHLISHFCNENLDIMAPEVLRCTLPTNELHYSSWIALGSSGELASSTQSLAYDTAPQTPQRMSEDLQRK